MTKALSSVFFVFITYISVFTLYQLDQFRMVKSYREVEDFSPLIFEKSSKDKGILVVGSCRAFDHFSSQVFSRNNYDLFLLAASGQKPVNSYYLLRYFESSLSRVSKAILVVDWFDLTQGGYDSFIMNLNKLKLKKDLLQMGLSISPARALHDYLFEVARENFGYEKIHFPTIGPEVKKAFSDYGKKVQINHKVMSDVMNKEQINYLKKMIKVLKEKKIKISLTVSPVMDMYKDELLKRNSMYSIFITTLKSVALEAQINFIDYNDHISTDNINFFSDYDSLSSHGVEKYNESIVKKIISRD